ncbi:MAG: hypothetical protein H6555_03500 [Lewinellaceae bacterium]|nr:hypothetical protein [Lewinellaceae bacterium]
MDPNEVKRQRDEFLKQFAPPEGNVFGWKFSLVGLGLIVFFTVLIIYRHVKYGVPPGLEDTTLTEQPIFPPPPVADTLLTKPDSLQ